MSDDFRETISRKRYKFIRNDGIQFLFSLVFIIIYVIKNQTMLFDTESVFETIYGIALLFLLNLIAGWYKKIFLRKKEDHIKLQFNCNKLLKEYKGSMHRFYRLDSVRVSTANDVVKATTCPVEFYFPYDKKGLKTYRIEVNDSNLMYELPEFIKDNFDELMEAHQVTNCYNQLNFRVKDWELSGTNTISMNTMRTTYYNSLVTNRAMDYTLENGLTVRDKFAYGPFITELKDSKLSNHLGFNGLVVTSDGWVPFVKRDHMVSVGKNCLGLSVEASLKVMYALKYKKDRLTEKGIFDAIRNEINDELKVPIEAIGNPMIIGAYRDFVEAGKPQLSILCQIYITKDKLTEEFTKEAKKTKKLFASKEVKAKMDGSNLLWVRVEDLMDMHLYNNHVQYRGKVYPMTPSSASSMNEVRKYINAVIKKQNAFEIK